MNDQDIAINVEAISKLYRIGLKEEASENLVGAILGFAKSPVKNFRKYRSLYNFSDLESGDLIDTVDAFWALKEVTFKVERGEVVGIIGTNGAGKSTLLKILARITSPTKGRAQIRGRISSLLEVGTGFHQELTGRENVFLNATILGMKKKEVENKFDQIVEFSGVEKFLDTPVKRYSVGMKVRLAFAVAAHLEPEILIVDEVLAVGDAEFQKKCLAKMQDVGQQGRTVLFVSHNMPAVTRLCQRAILLNNGRIVDDGPVGKVVHEYLAGSQGTAAIRTWPDLAKAPGNAVVRLYAVRAVTEDGQTPPNGFDIRRPIGLQMEFEVLNGGDRLMPYFDVFNDEGTKVFATIDLDPEWMNRDRDPGRYVSTAWIPGNLLSEGMLYVHAAMRTPELRNIPFLERDVIAFNIVDTVEGGSARGTWQGKLRGTIRPRLEWKTCFQQSNKQEIKKKDSA